MRSCSLALIAVAAGCGGRTLVDERAFEDAAATALEAGRPARAYELCRAAVEGWSSPAALTCFGRAAEMLGDDQGAVEAFGEIEAIAGATPDLATRVARLEAHAASIAPMAPCGEALAEPARCDCLLDAASWDAGDVRGAASCAHEPIAPGVDLVRVSSDGELRAVFVADGSHATALVVDGLSPTRHLTSVHAELRTTGARTYLWIEAALAEPAATRWLTLCRSSPLACTLELPLAGDGFTVDVAVDTDRVTVSATGPRAAELSRYVGMHPL